MAGAARGAGASERGEISSGSGVASPPRWTITTACRALVAVVRHGSARRLFLPVLFTIGTAGQPAQPTRFLLNQTLRREGDAWLIASILPIPLPPS